MSRKRVVSLADLLLRTSGGGGKFAFEAGRIGSAIGLSKLGAQYYVVQPGKTAVPFHAHYANEELYFVLEGEGVYRLGPDTFPVKAGDLMAAPAGGPETAHQLANTGTGPLRYLVLSTRNDPDVMVYPDSDKFMVAANVPEGGGGMSAAFHFIGRRDSAVGYYDGEEEAPATGAEA